MTDTTKLESAVAYLAGKLSPGKVKLFKLLFLADFEFYRENGQSLTGETYENFEMGPVPLTLWKRWGELTRKCATITLVPTGREPEQQLSGKPGYEPKLSPQERSYLDGVIQRYGDMSGNDLKHLTHQTIPFRATQRGEDIPYALAAYLHYQKPSRDVLNKLLQDNQLVTELRESLHASA